MPGNEDSITALKAAFQQKNLSLYFGAGISVESGIPSWDKLVLALYFRAAAGDWIYSRSPFPNYLYAIAEWQLERDHEPLDITARKIRHFYGDDETFFDDLRTTIYAGLKGDYSEQWQPDAFMLRQGNRTLDGVASLCERTNAQRGVRAVITYNYDNLVDRKSTRLNSSHVAISYAVF